jgi:DNA-binding MarR family transcriptional regulator
VASRATADRLVRLVYWTSSAGRQLRRSLSGLARQAGLSDCELLAVWLCLGEEGGMVQGALAAAVGVSPAQMSGIVERLRQRGLIEMHRNSLDRRRQVWRGTPAAKQLMDSLAGPLADLALRIEASVPAADQQAAQALTERLASAMESHSPESTPRPTDCSPRKAA